MRGVRAPRTPLSDAADAVWRAEHYRALGLLHKLDAPGAVALRLCVLRRTGQIELALKEFESRSLDEFDPTEAVISSSTVALALCQRLETEKARAVVAAAAPYVARGNDPLLAIEHLWIQAIVEFHAARLPESETLLTAALELVARHPNAESRAEYQPELNHLRARCLNALALIAAAAGDLKKEERLLVEALFCVRLARNRDVWLEAFLLANLAVLVGHSPNVRLRQLLVSRVADIQWHYGLDDKYDYVKNGLMQHRHLFGDDTLSGGVLSDTAHSLPWRLVSCVRALECEDFGSAELLEREITFGRSLAERADFASTQGEEIMSVVKLAAYLAPENAEAARALLGRYMAKMSVLPRTWVVVHAPFRTAEEAFTRGCIAKAEGRFHAATLEFANSMEVWSRVGLPQWAATAGLERYTVSRDQADLSAARSFVTRYPRTSFGRRLKRALAAAPASRSGDFVYVNPWRAERAVS